MGWPVCWRSGLLGEFDWAGQPCSQSEDVSDGRGMLVDSGLKRRFDRTDAQHDPVAMHREFSSCARVLQGSQQRHASVGYGTHTNGWKVCSAREQMSRRQAVKMRLHPPKVRGTMNRSGLPAALAADASQALKPSGSRRSNSSRYSWRAAITRRRTPGVSALWRIP